LEEVGPNPLEAREVFLVTQMFAGKRLRVIEPNVSLRVRGALNAYLK